MCPVQSSASADFATHYILYRRTRRGPHNAAVPFMRCSREIHLYINNSTSRILSCILISCQGTHMVRTSRWAKPIRMAMSILPFPDGDQLVFHCLSLHPIVLISGNAAPYTESPQREDKLRANVPSPAVLQSTYLPWSSTSGK
jgi:hypothetical protein